jgi:hypothetical protein
MTMALPFVDPTTPAEVVTQAFAAAKGEMVPVIVPAVTAIIGLGAMFWAARLVFKKTGIGKAKL